VDIEVSSQLSAYTLSVNVRNLRTVI